MNEVTSASVVEFLHRFERLDGGFIQHFVVDYKEGFAELLFTAFDTYQQDAGGAEKWVTLRLRLSRPSEFCFRQGMKESGVQLDDHLEIIWLDGRVFVILDPLQARDFAQPEWTLEQVRRSRWYVGGQSLSWELLQ